ncbi:uncharacterized protein LDX57_005481 [Aspergillus melleus]|uniref:uncharacterized protein n=1 Tax=Aspergillus melleus TaxID=138277 RepID=UPI001E8DD581|nr:uncharacterized protein LDX57_005481 [Aspergillus melleus]KAH8427774.1 hypothetical protein LDX57_005481 [Aspergillus melleus]
MGQELNGSANGNGLNGLTKGHLKGHTNGCVAIITLLEALADSLIRHTTPQKPSSTPPPPIAIIGMGMRLPGGCNDTESFWDLLMNKKEGMIPVPSTRWNEDGFHNPSGKPGTIRSKEGNFLQQDPAVFDAGFFSMTASQVEQVDPQQRILLETVYESLENAGEGNVRGKNIGVYVGTFAEVCWLCRSAARWPC